jgi:hypothetical protein
MNDPTEQPPGGGTDNETAWDAVEVMRRRADASRKERDASIAQLRAELGDDEVLDQFGIDLHGIEE